MVTMMMFYLHRALPKHRYDMTEVDYGGGEHHTRLRDPRDQLLCLQGVPPSPYIKEWRRGRRPAPYGAPHEESYSHRE